MVTITNLSVYNYPNNIAGSTTPIMSWNQSGTPTLYELQFSYNVNSFTSPTFDIQFQPESAVYQYLVSPEFSLTTEGTWYARMRGNDGSWGSYSTTLTFQVSLFPPAAPTINSIPVTASNFIQTISGTKLPNLYVYVSNNSGAWVEATYPNGLSGTTWLLPISLSSGNNNIVASTSSIHTTTGAMSIEVPLTLYLATSNQTPYNVWNSFDEMGLLLSLQRNPGEKNTPYRSRLKDVYTNPGNSTYTGLINGISRELGVSHSDISINALSDLMNPAYPGNLLNSEGSAIGTVLENYADEVYQANPVFLGTVICDQSYWDGVSQNTNSYTFLPHLWDASASGIYPKWQAGGIGDNSDLWVNGPVEVWVSGNNDYAWYLQMHTGYFYSTNPSGLVT